MENFGINSYAKRSIKVDGRYYHKRKETLLSHSKEVKSESVEILEQMQFVELAPFKPHESDIFDRLKYLKRLAGDKQYNYSQEEVKRIHTNGLAER
jgi:hypothetical protein